MARASTKTIQITRLDHQNISVTDDLLAAEEPLEIRIIYGDENAREQKSISITMRTPGHDFELASGFLFTEGIIENAAQINFMQHCNGLNENVVKVDLLAGIDMDISKLNRNFYTTSSCGVCGKASIDAVKTVCRLQNYNKETAGLEVEILYKLPDLLRNSQGVFAQTGGLHGCALFNFYGELFMAREDVGRHNAVDKLVGAALQQHLLPLNNFILLLSGRASFELIQKAYMAGIQVVAAVGAPSSLAVEMAEEAGITLIGFLRGERLNIYTGQHRFNLDKHSDTKMVIN